MAATASTAASTSQVQQESDARRKLCRIFPLSLIALLDCVENLRKIVVHLTFLYSVFFCYAFAIWFSRCFQIGSSTKLALEI